MQTIEIITSITGAKDVLVEDQAKGNAIFTAFMDVSQETKTWNIKPAFDKFKDPRRNSRVPKILIHKYSDADITIWMDGNKRLLVPPEEVVAAYLGDEHDMAIFAHVGRNCIYDEALVCAKLKLDDPEVIIEQAKYYEDHEYAKQKGLCEGGFIIRRNNARTQAFNEAWWADYCRFSRRDQLSLMPALDKVGLAVNIIDEKYINTPDGRVFRENGMVEYLSHAHFEGNFNDPNLK